MSELSKLLEALSNTSSNNITSTNFIDGERISIPKAMTKKQAAEELMRQHNEEENIVDVSQSYSWDWQDTLHAVKKVSEETFGWIQGKTIRTFFGTHHPNYIQICTNVVNGTKIYEECFYGNSVISAWEDANMSVSVNRSGKVSVSVNCKKRYKPNVLAFLKTINT